MAESSEFQQDLNPGAWIDFSTQCLRKLEVWIDRRFRVDRHITAAHLPHSCAIRETVTMTGLTAISGVAEERRTKASYRATCMPGISHLALAFPSSTCRSFIFLQMGPKQRPSCGSNSPGSYLLRCRHKLRKGGTSLYQLIPD